MNKKISKIVRKAHQEFDKEQHFIGMAANVYHKLAEREEKLPAKVKEHIMNAIQDEAAMAGVNTSNIMAEVRERLNEV